MLSRRQGQIAVGAGRRSPPGRAVIEASPLSCRNQVESEPMSCCRSARVVAGLSLRQIAVGALPTEPHLAAR